MGIWVWIRLQSYCRLVFFEYPSGPDTAFYQTVIGKKHRFGFGHLAQDDAVVDPGLWEGGVDARIISCRIICAGNQNILWKEFAILSKFVKSR